MEICFSSKHYQCQIDKIWILLIVIRHNTYSAYAVFEILEKQPCKLSRTPWCWRSDLVVLYFLVFLFNPSDQMWYPILSRFWVARIFWHILTESGFDFDIPFSMTSRKKAEFLLSSLLSLVALPRSKHVHYTNAWSFCSPERNELNFGAEKGIICLFQYRKRTNTKKSWLKIY